MCSVVSSVPAGALISIMTIFGLAWRNPSSKTADTKSNSVTP